MNQPDCQITPLLGAAGNVHLPLKATIGLVTPPPFANWPKSHASRRNVSPPYLRMSSLSLIALVPESQIKPFPLDLGRACASQTDVWGQLPVVQVDKKER